MDPWRVLCRTRRDSGQNTGPGLLLAASKDFLLHAAALISCGRRQGCPLPLFGQHLTVISVLISLSRMRTLLPWITASVTMA